MNTQRHINPYYSPGIKRNPAKRTYNDQEIMSQIAELVCKQYDIKEWQLKCNRRLRPYVRARQMFCYLTRDTKVEIPLKTIGGFLGRDHSTVIHSIRQIENDLTYIAQAKVEVEFLKREIGFIL